MRTGRLADATLRCAIRGEIDIDQAIRQALKDHPDLHQRARTDLHRARELLAIRRGPEVSQANKIVADLLTAAGIRPPTEGSR